MIFFLDETVWLTDNEIEKVLREVGKYKQLK